MVKFIKPIGKLVPVVFIALVFIVIYTIYVEFVCMPYFQFDVDTQYRIEARQKDGYRHLLFYHALCLMTVWSVVMTSVTDPGYIPGGVVFWVLHAISPDEWKNVEYAKSESLERMKNGDLRFCPKEQCYKPDRAHYCSNMGRCILKMDHYCPWLSNGIGFYNYKFFLQSLLYANVTNGFMMYNVYFEFFRVYQDFNASFNQLFYLALLGALLAFISCITWPFMLFHFWLVAHNKTTIEYYQVAEGCTINYDCGIHYNIKSVFGHRLIDLLLPIGGPIGDGVHFPSGGSCKVLSFIHYWPSY